MNDPHVKLLIYRVQHDESVNYDKAVPLEFDATDFTVRVENGEARFSMKNHFASVEAARSVVDPLVRTWEFAANLERGSGEFELRFKDAEIEDRSADSKILYASAGIYAVVGMDATLTVSRGRYPDPPSGIAVDSDVEAMASRLSRYRQGKDTLATVAYFCLTVLEHTAGGRAAAARQYNVADAVLRTLGRLCGEKGGPDARKARGWAQAFTAAETEWLDAAVRKLIHRAAQVAHDPAQNLPQVTMADLPALP